jgi:small subunit ribosomal protein S24
MAGTWHGLFLSDLIIKRRQNLIILAGFVKSPLQTRQLYFLKGYTEELLAKFLKRPVRVEIQLARMHNLIHKLV